MCSFYQSNGITSSSLIQCAYCMLEGRWYPVLAENCSFRVSSWVYPELFFLMFYQGGNFHMVVVWNVGSVSHCHGPTPLSPLLWSVSYVQITLHFCRNRYSIRSQESAVWGSVGRKDKHVLRISPWPFQDTKFNITNLLPNGFLEE